MKAIAACSILKIMWTFWISQLFGKACISQVMNWNTTSLNIMIRNFGGNEIEEIYRCPFTSCSYDFLPYVFLVQYMALKVLCLFDLTMFYQLQELGSCIELWKYVARMHKISYTCKVRLQNPHSTIFYFSQWLLGLSGYWTIDVCNSIQFLAYTPLSNMLVFQNQNLCICMNR